MARWSVQIIDEVARVFESDELTTDDLFVIQSWAKVVRDHGPDALAEQPGRWADHALYGEWRGHRASRFSHSGRIIYKVEEQVITVVVVRITTEHDYRRVR